MISDAIKERKSECYNFKKKSMIVTTDSRILNALNSSSMLSSINI